MSIPPNFSGTILLNSQKAVRQHIWRGRQGLLLSSGAKVQNKMRNERKVFDHFFHFPKFFIFSTFHKSERMPHLFEIVQNLYTESAQDVLFR